MKIRQDKFEVGDSVIWYDEEWAETADARKRHGEGPFLVREVVDMSKWARSVGHTQHIIIGPDRNKHRLSGAFFKKVTK